MAVSNEVTVDRLALKRAVGKLRSGPEGEGDLTLLYVEDGGFWIETRVTATNLKAVGQWGDDIAVHASDLQGIVAELPPSKEVTLLYSAGWLFVGDERLPAREIGSD